MGNKRGKDMVNTAGTLKGEDDTIGKKTSHAVHKVHNKRISSIFSRRGTEQTSGTTDQFACYQLYTNCTKIITTRVEKKLDDNLPREQSGFRSCYDRSHPSI